MYFVLSKLSSYAYDIQISPEVSFLMSNIFIEDLDLIELRNGLSGVL